jgi:RNA polymerase sigma-70 factor (ECF subfamily)
VIAEAPATQAYQQVQRYLFTVAYRMTGSASDAEDLVHDAWIRYLDAGSPEVDSLRAYLTTIVSRLSLDYLKSARVKREQYTGPWMPEPVPTASALGDPAATTEQRESVSMAFLTLLERLTPEQRVVFVLREALGLPYDEIARHVGKSAAACRQIFHRAQGRLGEDRQPTIAPAEEHRRLVERFLEVVQTGDAARIASLLTEDVVLAGDGGPNRMAARRPVVGVDKVSRGLAGYASNFADLLRGASLAIVELNGAPAVAVRIDGTLDQVYALDIREGRIAAVRAVLNLDKLRYLERALASGQARATELGGMPWA